MGIINRGAMESSSGNEVWNARLRLFRGHGISCSKWQGVLPFYNWFHSSSVVVSCLEGGLIVSWTARLSDQCSYGVLSRNTVQEDWAVFLHTLQGCCMNPILCLFCLFCHFLSLQPLELTCNMAVLPSLTHIPMLRWPSGRLIRECSVYKPQDQCPLQ